MSEFLILIFLWIVNERVAVSIFVYLFRCVNVILILFGDGGVALLCVVYDFVYRHPCPTVSCVLRVS